MGKLNPNAFQRGFKGLKNDKIKQLKKIIAADLKNYNEEIDKFMKEFKRRHVKSRIPHSTPLLLVN